MMLSINRRRKRKPLCKTRPVYKLVKHPICPLRNETLFGYKVRMASFIDNGTSFMTHRYWVALSAGSVW